MRRIMAFLGGVVIAACSGSDPGLGSGGDAATGGNDGSSSDGSAADGGSTDGTAQDGGSDAAAMACTADGGFPDFVTACTNTQSCIVKLHQIDCCGTKDAIGVNHDQYNAFDQAESAWEAQCPACGCPPGPTTAQDGKTGSSSSVKVECTDFDGGTGVCRTYFQ